MADPPRPLVVADVTVIDGTGSPALTHRDVHIADGRITAVLLSGAAESPEGARVLDGAGRHLIPGMWETQSHLTRYANGIPGEHDVDWATDGDFEILEANTRAYLRHGFTSVVDLGGPEEVLADIRDQVDEGRLPGPRVLFVGRQFVPPGGLPRFGDRPMTSLLVEVADEPQVVQALDRMSARGISAVKINHIPEMLPFGSGWPAMSQAALEALVRHAHERDLPVLVHVDRAERAAEVLRLGVDGIEHFPEVHDTDVERDVELLTRLCLEHDAFWAMTLSFHEGFARLGDRSLLHDLRVHGEVLPRVLERLTTDPESMWNSTPPEILDYFNGRFRAAMAHVRQVHAAGVKMTISSDSGNAGTFHGLSCRRELELMGQAGIAPLDILQAATRRAAEKFGRAADLGTIQPGKLADLVLLSADPLTDIANVGEVELVVRGGEPHCPDEIPL
jgi:imidazolonepropionase-like amidohydrolase